MNEPYWILAVFVIFFVYTLYVYRKGYQAGQQRTQRMWFEIFKAKVDKDGIEGLEDSFEEFLEK